jgi:hypothetical protein
MMRDDDQRPSQYETVYNTLWDEYRNTIESLRELDSDAVNQFRNKVLARVKELEIRINDLSDDWDPDYFDYFERILACYEKNYDLMVALRPKQSEALVLRCKDEVPNPEGIQPSLLMGVATLPADGGQ